MTKKKKNKSSLEKVVAKVTIFTKEEFNIKRHLEEEEELKTNEIIEEFEQNSEDGEIAILRQNSIGS